MKILKWAGIVIGVLIILLIIFIAFIFISSNSKLDQIYTITAGTISVPTDSISIETGKHIADTRGCTDCHGGNLGGTVFMDNPAMGKIVSPNLTAGKGGLGDNYSIEDWVKSIRHGINADGKGLLIMPAEDYFYMSDEDLGDLIAYIKSVDKVDNVLPENSPGPITRMLLATGGLQLAPDKINHEEERTEMPEKTVSVEYGKYLAYNCIGCHGRDFSGGPIPGGDPNWPPAANITPDIQTGLGNWADADFIKAIRDGIRKDGTEIHPSMPRALGNFTDDELKAIWMYLNSVEPKNISYK